MDTVTVKVIILLNLWPTYLHTWCHSSSPLFTFLDLPFALPTTAPKKGLLSEIHECGNSHRTWTLQSWQHWMLDRDPRRSYIFCLPGILNPNPRCFPSACCTLNPKLFQQNDKYSLLFEILSNLLHLLEYAYKYYFSLSIQPSLCKDFAEMCSL
jgi:hypothetical protein